jgi:hypothetical protein
MMTEPAVLTLGPRHVDVVMEKEKRIASRDFVSSDVLLARVEAFANDYAVLQDVDLA